MDSGLKLQLCQFADPSQHSQEIPSSKLRKTDDEFLEENVGRELVKKTSDKHYRAVAGIRKDLRDCVAGPALPRILDRNYSLSTCNELKISNRRLCNRPVIIAG